MMKTILVIIGVLAIIGLNQALPNQPNNESKEENHQTEVQQVQLKNLLWSMRKASSLIGQSYTEALAGQNPKSMTMNKMSGLNLPRPSNYFHPLRIRHEKLKEKWDNFKYYNGLGPVTRRPFTYMDLRIIG